MDPKYLMNNLTKTFSLFLIVIPPLSLMTLWYLPLTQSRRERVDANALSSPNVLG